MRKILLPIIIIVSTIIILIRLFYLQIIDDKLKIKADNNAIKIIYDFPERGYIYDRNDSLLVANQSSYDVMVVPREIKDLDTIEFCQLLGVEKEYFIKKVEKARVYSPRLPSVFLAQLTKLEFAPFQEKIRKFKGFYIQKRFLRDYQTKNAANIFGFITQANQAIVDKNPYYNSGDLIGVQGLEKEYEELLRGIKGVKYLQKDRFNREIGSYKNGIYDTIPIEGKDLTLTIDINLQRYGEELMVNKRGGIVAIEPNTGEILALISAPSYDPALLVGKDRSKNYTALYNDLAQPLYDRALLAEYPPGSPFKIITGLIGLQEQVIEEETGFICRHGFSYGRGAFMRCHDAGTNNLHTGMYKSCNTYFANVFKRIIDKYKSPAFAVDNWRKHVTSFGFGNFLGNDLPIGRPGSIPSSKLYNKFYPNGGWRSNTIISNAIGQGEINTTPLQLANMMAAVANQGYFYTPHIVKKIKDFKIDKKFTTKHITTIEKKYFQPVINGLADVYNPGGTAATLRVNGLEICGKTGTAENFTKINGVRTQLTDHSVFVAFAPKDNPKIAIAVLVENGYWGNRFAGPIATLMIEKYINNEITRKDLEKNMLEKSLQLEYDKATSGLPFTINR